MAVKELMIDTSVLIDYFRKTNKANSRFIAHFQNFEQIYISNAEELENIEFLRDKARLKDLYVSDSKISNLNPLVELMKYQSDLVEKYPEEFLHINYKM